MDKAPGEIIAAKYSADGKWYRARVLIVEENRVRVTSSMKQILSVHYKYIYKFGLSPFLF